jgi:hypothetical protein
MFLQDREGGIKETLFSRDSRVLDKEGKRGMFVPVDVVGGGALDFRVELRGGRVLHVPACFEEGALRRLVVVAVVPQIRLRTRRRRRGRAGRRPRPGGRPIPPDEDSSRKCGRS